MLGRFLLVGAFALTPGFVCAQSGSPIGPEFRVNTFTTGDQAYPSIAADSAGDFVVAWMSYGQDGSLFGIFAQRYSSYGVPLGPEFRVNTYTTNHQYVPSVARSPAGSFVVAWQSLEQDGSYHGVFGQRYSNAGTPLGGEFRVNTFTTGPQRFPSVAADSLGNFVIVWVTYDQDGSHWSVFGQRYTSNGIPLGSEFRVNTYTPDDQWWPSVASDAAGNFVVVWESEAQDDSARGVFGQRFSSSGAPLGGEFRANSYTTSFQGFPSLAADPTGSFLVAWISSQQDGSSWGVFGQRYSNSGLPLGSEFQINTYTTDGQSGPGAAFDSNGNFVVVWQSNSQDGSNYGVFGQRYSGDGSVLGPEFRVNTYTTFAQWLADISSDAAGNFVVVWDSALQDGSGRGIFAQRYSQIVPVQLVGFRVE
jgi:hypothetical protein